MIKCVYCKKEIKYTEIKFASVIYTGEWVCEKCVHEEDHLWFSSNKGINFPDFTKELNLELFIEESKDE